MELSEKQILGEFDYKQEKRVLEKPSCDAFGITNETEDGKRIFFGDYDSITEVHLLSELAFLRKRFPKYLTSFLILESSFQNYHAISFAKMGLGKLSEILHESNELDNNFRERLKKYKENTVRISPKYEIGTNKIIKERPNFVMWFPNTCDFSGEVSRAHYNFYTSRLGYPEILSNKGWDFDGLDWIMNVRFDSLDKKEEQ